MNTDPLQTTPFLALLHRGFGQGGFETDDALAVLLPLFRQIANAHERGLVAPLRGTANLLVAENDELSVAPSAFVAPTRNVHRIEALLSTASAALEIVGHSRQTTDLSEARHESVNLEVAASDETITKPVFLPGYQSWEHALGHHDPVTDIFSLGLLLASVSCGLDFTRTDDVTSFAARRQNLFAINPRVHPVIARVIVQMTELNRHKRAQDLQQIARSLENYRDQPGDLDLSSIQQSGTRADRRRLIQDNLRDRLFEISRRNRLIHFKPTLQTLNLTVASVPLVMDVKNIRLDQLFLWHPPLSADLSEGRAISLGKYLRIEDAPYIPVVLDKIIAEARRDRAEYGFAQLRLVLCFLRWHNLKEEPKERIHSPLLLLPVELAKRKGVRDAYVLTPSSTEAEVNPALRHHLKTLYGVSLPETIDLQETSLEAFHSNLQNQIRASEPGVTLEKIDRPKIELIHAKARQRLDQWKQRQRPRSVAPSKGADDVDHSYNREHYRPRGLQLFLEKVRPKKCPLADLAGAPPSPRLPGWVADADDTSASPASAPVMESDRQMFALREGETGNPYHWSFDLCSLTLGNFHYRKMTLVRDYTKLSEDGATSPAFDSVFSLEPKHTDDQPLAPLPLPEQFPVIPCDAAQAAAVARSRDGRSFIIQGPPGTGKSQTITNLIADYVARGKRVLFVCEKRAAIDVVFHRLRQQGLDELCCLIHDSQTDKKAFIQNLKQTYEQWLAEPVSEEPARTRENSLRAIEHDLAALARFSGAMTNIAPASGVGTRRLIHRLVETTENRPTLNTQLEDLLPVYSLWLSYGSLVERLDNTLRTLGQPPVFARHPLRWLGRDVILSPRPVERLGQLLDEIEPLLDSLETSLELSGLPEDLCDTLPEIAAILDFAHRILPLATQGRIALLDAASPQSRELQQALAALDASEKALAAARLETVAWKEKLTPADTLSALEAARRFDASFLRFLQPAFWNLRKTVNARYDFTQHAVPPTLTRTLENLHAEHTAAQKCSELAATFSSDFAQFTPASLLALLESCRGTSQPLPSASAAFRRALIASPDSSALVRSLAEIHPEFARLKTTIATLLHSSDALSFTSLRDVLSGLRSESRALPDLLPLLTELVDAPEALRHALLHADLRLDQFEHGSAAKTLNTLYRADTALTRFDGRILDAYRARLDDHHRTLLKTNATVIRNRVRHQFRENVQISNLVAAQLTEEQKAFKKIYATGRRELEHEFGKTMRYKSIRDLAANATGAVVRDLKPIWLMSPLSVSDTLPLDPSLFDVVIFDEASQIPVEEAVPAVYRAPQVIVVGDEMQLPPTSFFSSARSDDETLETDEAGERIEVDLDADSFLAQSARNLPSTLLAWHYRSRYENLISFSNAAFYSGNLFTIPDRHLPSATQPELVVKSAEDGATHIDALLARSISFHFLETGLYEQRRNSSEAAYIAQSVRELLRRDTKLSIGIVAFSEAQQSEIERALDALAETDADFAARYEAELNREENDQFCGLFIKNLENVQGDERDIILLSICYGYDRDKRMLMNFGPINQRGGEKRLNVIFSRARHHMAVISSIRHHDITNDYNDGANALRNFLRYAESLSRGDLVTARSVLENLNPLNRRALAPPTSRDAVIEQIATALRAKGHLVDLNAGQSRFRCDLAIRAADQRAYTLGLLIDTDAHYENTDLVDRYLTRPAILEAFGWQILLVLTKDWLHEPAAVLNRIERQLSGENPDSIETPALPEIPKEISPSPASPPVPAFTPAQISPSTAAGEPPESKPSASTPISVTGTTNASWSRHLEYTEGGSKKFWRISVNGPAFVVHFGRIGTAGQSQQKQFSTESEAIAAATQLAQSKIKKGYTERSAG
jgi:predicted DNA-binding WGR domain protein